MNANELKAHIGLGTVYLVCEEKAGMAYVGYGFECTWDPEHGLGVATHRKRILEVGDEEAAFPQVVPRVKQRTLKKSPTAAAPKPLDLKQLPLAVGSRDRKLIKALLEAGAVPDKHYAGWVYSPVEMAVAGRDSALLELLLQFARRPLSKKLIGCVNDTRKRSLIKVVEDYATKTRRRK